MTALLNHITTFELEYSTCPRSKVYVYKMEKNSIKFLI
jgi:hypothetical protein